MCHIRIHVYEYTQQMFASNLPHRDRKPKYTRKFWTKHRGDGKQWPLTPLPSLRLGLPIPQPSRRHHAQSLGPVYHDPRTHHVLESHTERAAPLSRRDDERRHAAAAGYHSAFALRLHLAACNTSSICCFWVLEHLCSNLSQSFHSSIFPASTYRGLALVKTMPSSLSPLVCIHPAHQWHLLLLRLGFSTKPQRQCLQFARVCGLCHHPSLSNSGNVSGHHLAGMGWLRLVGSIKL